MLGVSYLLLLFSVPLTVDFPFCVCVCVCVCVCDATDAELLECVYRYINVHIYRQLHRIMY
ncbi:hypothetical protein M752DRAFT_125648 [Aspergillus phoenicis ATCC 13157]|uniref:Secreted protein n=1 Tax=Aspergillus phoenicis ATCC 13157 TaxID=1353007 RepID=A0A370P3G0_ASPPH|nr:hypothetical protein M752DRAFT_125648 [Aspergillus phoenicis ATCC 13157]